MFYKRTSLHGGCAPAVLQYMFIKLESRVNFSFFFFLFFVPAFLQETEEKKGIRGKFGRCKLAMLVLQFIVNLSGSAAFGYFLYEHVHGFHSSK